jgi:ribosomal protein S27E
MSSFYTDLELELLKARQTALVMEAILAFSRPTREIDATCQDCGRRVIHATRDPHAPADLRVRCNDCAESDKPTQYPDTGWRMGS